MSDATQHSPTARVVPYRKGGGIEGVELRVCTEAEEFRDGPNRDRGCEIPTVGVEFQSYYNRRVLTYSTISEAIKEE